jgi:hypothetical protein
MALARLAGLLDLKMPDPTKTPLHPNCITKAASAGVAIPPAAKLTTGKRPSWAVCRSSSRSDPVSLANALRAPQLPFSSFYPALPGVERPTASAKCFMSSILRGSELGYFLSYPRRRRCLLLLLDLMISTTHAFQNFHHCGVPRFTTWSKFSVNGITVDPGPVFGEPIP